MKKTIVANWKMNLSVKESLSLAKKVNKISSQNNIIVCPDFLSIVSIKNNLKKINFKLGAQNCAPESFGSYTGEVCASNLKDLEVEQVIIGHSERRNIFKEDSLMINKKVYQALKNKLQVILCLGENEQEKKGKKTKAIIKKQLQDVLKNVDDKNISQITIAYEPIWAIGSGKTPKVEEVSLLVDYIKDYIFKNHGKKIKVLYGGSVNLKNYNSFLNQKNIDGLLIGGASLKYQEFSKICR